MITKTFTEIEASLGVDGPDDVSNAVGVYNEVISRCESERIEITDTSFQTEEGRVVLKVTIKSEESYKEKKHREITQSTARKVNDHTNPVVAYSYETYQTETGEEDEEQE